MGGRVHPQIGWTIARLLARLNEAPHYLAITGPANLARLDELRPVIAWERDER